MNEDINKTISCICNWIQAELSNTNNSSQKNVTRMIDLLINLIRANEVYNKNVTGSLNCTSSTSFPKNINVTY